ncbi:hypothetical protein NHH03_16140 [Stieleria sp. TO1_6]|uniref:hypothetical protein n=1 Tax=Stieleria tagensis TaxID=2956795 RepID=UPI00209B3090|nr:hypothetical protein [Stieleria tagensis]MCO8123280.1 hypothetical protein [Stieleria tagensis]
MMKRRRLKVSILTVLALVALSAIVFATLAARPSETIRIMAHGNGDFTFESQTYSSSELKDAISDAIELRKRWFVNSRTQINFEPGVEFATVPQVMSLVASAGCEDVQVGLPPEMSGRLSHPELTSEPW